MSLKIYFLSLNSPENTVPLGQTHHPHYNVRKGCKKKAKENFLFQTIQDLNIHGPSLIKLITIQTKGKSTLSNSPFLFLISKTTTFLNINLFYIFKKKNLI